MNGDIFDTVDWIEKLVKESWCGYYLMGISQSENAKSNLTASRIVGSLNDHPRKTLSAYAETAKLLNGEKSDYGIFGSRAGFVTLGWVEPIFNYVTSLVAYWSIINNEYPSVKVSRIISDYQTWKTRTNDHSGPELKVNTFIGNRMLVDTTLVQGGNNTDMLKWNFFCSNDKKLQEFLKNNMKELGKVQILENQISVHGVFEMLSICFSNE